MQNNAINNCQPYPQQGPNAVNISIYSPQAYGNTSASIPACTPASSNFYSIYGTNPQPNLPLYPANYNNMIERTQPYQNLYPANTYGVANPQQNPYGYPNGTYNNGQQNPDLYPGRMYDQAYENTPQNGLYPENYENADKMSQQNQLPNNQANKTSNDANAKYGVSENSSNNSSTSDATEKSKDKKEKKITPLTDDYIKSLENYLNNQNQKIRLIGAKELLERFKEDENRKDNPSLVPLVNKILKDPSPTVRFLGLTMLQLDYCTGNDETVSLLKQIQQENKDKIGQEQLLASEILLKMSAPDKIKIKENK